MTLALQIDPRYDTDANRRVDLPNVLLNVDTNPSVLIQLDKGANGSVELEQPADLTGRASLPVSLTEGLNRFLATVTDRFGQHATADLTITYTLPTGNRPPIVLGSDPAPYDIPALPGPPQGTVSTPGLTLTLAPGQTTSRQVSLTLPAQGTASMVDVFLLFDDTGSFESTLPALAALFPSLIQQLQADLPGTSLAFGLGRFEDYTNLDRPFILGQPILDTNAQGFEDAIRAALSRREPGFGGDEPESLLEGLSQVALGAGFDSNHDGDFLDYNDVRPFSAYVPDPAKLQRPASGSLGGVGFRPGALPIILVATDTGTVYQPDGHTVITGVGSTQVPLSQLTASSRATTPDGRGASFQPTIDALNQLGALVIGLGTGSTADAAPRQTLEALATLTGARNASTTSIPSGIPSDPIDPGDPLYFLVNAASAPQISSGISAAINGALRSVPSDVELVVTDPASGTVNRTGIATGVPPGGIARFNLDFTGASTSRPIRLDFMKPGTGILLGTIPARVLAPHQFRVDAFDPDGDPFSYRLITAPNGAQINATSGLISWMPTTRGRYRFVIELDDHNGGLTLHTAWVTITEGGMG